MVGGCRFGSGERTMWFDLAAIRLAAAIASNVLALAVHIASISQSLYWLWSGRPRNSRREGNGLCATRPHALTS
jgi:hypothetical protein